MPLMDVTYPQGAIAPEARAALVDDLTTVLRAAAAEQREKEQSGVGG